MFSLYIFSLQEGVIILVRAAALVSGDGYRLQAVLDAVYFQEIPNFELVAVLSPDKNTKAIKRAASSGIPSFVVDPDLFPNITSHSMAIANKLRDMDIDLVILAGYNLDLGVIPYQYKHKIIGTTPVLIPAFEDITEDNIFHAVLERGVKITGATAFFADNDGHAGDIILQKAIDVRPDDTPDSLRSRVIEEGEWKLLPQAISLYCEGRLSHHGNRVLIASN